MTICVDCRAPVRVVDRAAVMECHCTGYEHHWLTQDEVNRCLAWMELVEQARAQKRANLVPWRVRR